MNNSSSWRGGKLNPYKVRSPVGPTGQCLDSLRNEDRRQIYSCTLRLNNSSTWIIAGATLCCSIIGRIVFFRSGKRKGKTKKIKSNKKTTKRKIGKKWTTTTTTTTRGVLLSLNRFFSRALEDTSVIKDQRARIMTIINATICAGK